MRVAIGVLADALAARALACAWLTDDCPAERLQLYADARVALDAADGTASPTLVRLARHGPCVAWALRAAVHDRDRSARPARQARRALLLLGRLRLDGDGGEWPAYARALADGHPLGVVRLASVDPDIVRLTRPVLAHAVRPVRLRDLSATASGARPPPSPDARR